MSRFIFLSFAFLGWAFYEVSGGPDFQPRIAVALAATDSPATQSVLSAPVNAPATTEVVQTSKASQDTGLIVTRMIVADQATPGQGITSYSMSGTLSSNAPKLTFSLSATGPAPDIRRIRADKVNMRTGPGTEFVVVDNLSLDTRVKLLDGSVQGWVKLRSLDSGRVGWIQRRFLATLAS